MAALDEPYRFDEWRPLQLAAAVGDESKVLSLLSAGANPQALSSSRTKPCHAALHVAARYGHADICRILCEVADPNQLDTLGYSPLHYAAIGNHVRTTRQLLRAGAVDVSSDGSSGRASAGQLARSKGFTKVAELLDEQRGDDKRLSQWLKSIGCECYHHRFVAAGYDYDLIAEHGLTKEDVEAIGIPKEKRGHQKKLITKHKFPADDDGEESTEEEDESSDDEEEEEESDEDSES